MRVKLSYNDFLIAAGASMLYFFLKTLFFKADLMAPSGETELLGECEFLTVVLFLADEGLLLG